MGCPPGEQHLSAARAGGILPAFLHRAGVRSTRSKGVGWDSGQIRWVKLSADVFPGPRAAADPLRRWPVIRSHFTFKCCVIFKHLFGIWAKPGEKKEFAKKAPVPRAWPVLQTAKLEKTQTEAWARSKSEELPKSKAKDQSRGSASARLTRLWDFCSRFTPREQRRDQPERLRGTFAGTHCGVPPGGRGDASPQGLGFHGSAALERQLLHLVGTAPAGLGALLISQMILIFRKKAVSEDKSGRNCFRYSFGSTKQTSCEAVGWWS